MKVSAVVHTKIDFYSNFTLIILQCKNALNPNWCAAVSVPTLLCWKMSQSKRILVGRWTHPLLQTYNREGQTLKHLTHLCATFTALCSMQIKTSIYYAKLTQMHSLTAKLRIDTCFCKIDLCKCNHQERCMFPCRGTCCLQILQHSALQSNAAGFLCHATAKGSKQMVRIA